MMLKDLPYPLRLCVELMHYAALSSEQTQHFRPSELRPVLQVFFPEAMIDQAAEILTGKWPEVNLEITKGGEV